MASLYLNAALMALIYLAPRPAPEKFLKGR